jgi:hypothetical protein
VLVATAVIAVRAAVLGSNVIGTYTADALSGTGLFGRARTMLGVVGEWARLLLWPGRLQADYGLNEIVPAQSFGAAQWIGAGLAGAVIAGAILALAWRRPEGASGAVRWLAFGAMLLLVTLGLLKSRARHADWKDQETLLRRTVVDAPKSFSAHLAMTRFLEDSGSAAQATESYRKALAIRPELLGMDRARADQYRQEGFCRPAARLYRRLLGVVPQDSALRASLRACGDSAATGPQREAP